MTHAKIRSLVVSARIAEIPDSFCPDASRIYAALGHCTTVCLALLVYRLRRLVSHA
ncbi:MAG: hypothetical protein MI802_23295 [Desulfobacterales bacterium]|nr:hypothetical protein [Desulfobacterales bacterium]